MKSSGLGRAYGIAIIGVLASALATCDRPPETWESIPPDACGLDEGDACEDSAGPDADADTDVDTDADSDTDADADTSGLNCMEALGCLLEGVDLASCLAGLDAESTRLMLALGGCALSAGCMNAEDMQTCIAQNCSAEMLACITDA